MKKEVYYVSLLNNEVFVILRKRGKQLLNENVLATHDGPLCR